MEKQVHIKTGHCFIHFAKQTVHTKNLEKLEFTNADKFKKILNHVQSQIIFKGYQRIYQLYKGP